jgi:hypothetical protein
MPQPAARGSGLAGTQPPVAKAARVFAMIFFKSQGSSASWPIHEQEEISQKQTKGTEKRFGKSTALPSPPPFPPVKPPAQQFSFCEIEVRKCRGEKHLSSFTPSQNENCCAASEQILTV